MIAMLEKFYGLLQNIQFRLHILRTLQREDIYVQFSLKKHISFENPIHEHLALLATS